MVHSSVEKLIEQLITGNVSDQDTARLAALLIYDGDNFDAILKIVENIGISKDVITTLATGGSIKQVKKDAMTKISAARLKALAELLRRAGSTKAKRKPIIISNQDIVSFIRPEIGALPYEEVWVILLNGANRVIDKLRISSGGVGSALIDNRVVLKHAVEHLATSIIIAHNHPSGNPTPSENDRRQTDSLRIACGYFNITLLDHIIITEDDYYSFAHAQLV